MAGVFSLRPDLKLHRVVMVWLYPRLQELPAEAWQSVLGKARGAEMETAERVGVVGGVGVAAWLLGVEPSVFSTQPPILVHLLQFVLAVPLLVILVGPIHVRRTRRGLNHELARRAVYTAGGQAHGSQKET
ncbi:MAG: hypothetical protein IPO58_07795 [Betaproteobacteria bacterium]|nr:hypothetical protein [Betaproteobacteria bacterium]